eukprot:COSAG02_NODE_4534_length_5245_cov_13.164594_6_plen_76_part_00
MLQCELWLLTGDWINSSAVTAPTRRALCLGGIPAAAEARLPCTMDGSAELDVQATPAFAVLDELFKSGKIGTETK